MEFATIIGVMASTLTAVSLLPQLIKMLREKKSGDVSILMLIVLCTGNALWVWYGGLHSDWIIIISNAVALGINGISGVLTYRYR